MTDAVGTYRAYTTKRPSARREELIVRAARIVDEYERAGYTVTLRQLFYKHVTLGLVENTQAEYNKLGGIVTDGRMCGMISWTGLEDRGRFLQGLPTFDGPAHAIASVTEGYKLDLWAGQHTRPEVWVEKAALAGVLGSICNELRVDFFACRGYSSASEMWRAGGRFRARIAAGQRPMVLYLGDHDPSGVHMTQDIEDRLRTFVGTTVQVVRLALNSDQIDRLRLPPNPAKQTDSRFASYAAQHGDESWELDALEPAYIQQLIRDAVDRLRDEALFSSALGREVADREYLQQMAQGGEE